MTQAKPNKYRSDFPSASSALVLPPRSATKSEGAKSMLRIPATGGEQRGSATFPRSHRLRPPPILRRLAVLARPGIDPARRDQMALFGLGPALGDMAGAHPLAERVERRGERLAHLFIGRRPQPDAAPARPACACPTGALDPADPDRLDINARQPPRARAAACPRRRSSRIAGPRERAQEDVAPEGDSSCLP
jgi:hypothetical protein